MFTTDYHEILKLIDCIDPKKYGKTRNFCDGAVTQLSPYVSRGVISTRQIAKAILKKGYKPYEIEGFLRQLAWRDYFQHVWIAKPTEIDDDLKQHQRAVSHYLIPEAIVSAHTSIDAIDRAIKDLYSFGYIHNHIRMYIASVCCNVAGSHWRYPAQWMYYYLLDADWASNALSWQWVAGCFSHKKYFANQENINKYWYTHQKDTFLDIPYDAFATMTLPDVLKSTAHLSLHTTLPPSDTLIIDPRLPIYIYTFYNLDVEWDSSILANRILLLEPSFFNRYPVSEATINFIIALSKNIKDIQIIVGEFDAVFNPSLHAQIRYKEHPAFSHFKGHKCHRDWMFEHVSGYYPSFFSYWKKCQKFLTLLED